MSRVRAFAPGRVNLIGEHTDYTGGLVLPFAAHLGTTIDFERDGSPSVRLTSADEPQPVEVALDITVSAISDLRPRWGRFVAGVAALAGQRLSGGIGSVSTTLPIGAGMSSSTSFTVAAALAMGAGPPPRRPQEKQAGPSLLAALCQRVEQVASGVPCGIMDQLTVTSGVAGAALLVDCHTMGTTPVPLPETCEVIVVHSGQARLLADSEYATRRAECEAAEAVIGPLRLATPADVAGLADPIVRRRARHVVTENQRVRDVAAALASLDPVIAGAVITAGHRSLRDDFGVSTPALDATVDQLLATPGVLGARLMGAGFGGCVVALAETGTAPTEGAAFAGGRRWWRVAPSEGAWVRPT